MLKKVPFILATLSLVGGIFISILFGVNESYFKKNIAAGLQQNQKIMSMTDTNAQKAKLSKEAAKNWRYYQRFHFHSTAIGSMTFAILIFLSFVAAPEKLIILTSYLTGVGGFLYPYVWLFAGIYGPSMGRHEAKEAFAPFAYGGGMYLVGLLMLLFIVIKYPIKFNGPTDK